jgi:hypothetical protein
MRGPFFQTTGNFPGILKLVHVPDVSLKFVFVMYKFSCRQGTFPRAGKTYVIAYLHENYTFVLPTYYEIWRPPDSLYQKIT